MSIDVSVTQSTITATATDGGANVSVAESPISVSVGVLGSITALNVSIADAGEYYTGTEVETALQEIGASIAGLGTPVAADVTIADGGGYYTGGNVELALQEIGAGTTLDARYVEIAGDEMTGDLGINGGDLTSSAATFNLLNATPTTINFGAGASTAINVGNASGDLVVLADEARFDIGFFRYRDVNDSFATVRFDGNNSRGQIWLGTNADNDEFAIRDNGYWRLLTTVSRNLALGTNDTDALRIDNSQNIAIGGATPLARLHVIGTADDEQLIVQAHSSQTANILEVQDSDGNADILVVDGIGQVAIGIDTPATTVHIVRGGDDGGLLIDTYADGVDYSFLGLRRSNNDTIGTLTKLDAEDLIAQINFEAPNSAETVFNEAAQITVYHDGTASSYPPGRMHIETFDRLNGRNTNQLVLNSAGNVGIGVVDPDARLEVMAAGAAGALKISRTGSASSGVFDLANARLNLTSSSGLLTLSDVTTNSTVKNSRLGTTHYDTSEEPFFFFLGGANLATNVLSLGGGTSLGNAATDIGFYTAADTITTTGTKRMLIDSGGLVTVGATGLAGRFNVLGSTDIVQTIIQAHSSQTANVFEMQNSSATPLFAVSGIGEVSCGFIDAPESILHVKQADANLIIQDTDTAFATTQAYVDFTGTEGDGSARDNIRFRTGMAPDRRYIIAFGATPTELFAIDRLGSAILSSTTATALTIGAGTADIDYNITFNGETNDGVLTWMEDEDYFQFADAVLMDVRLTLGDSASIAPLSVTERAAEPSAPVSGDIYLDDGTNTASTGPGWRRYTGAAWEDISAGASGGAVATDVIWDALGDLAAGTGSDTAIRLAVGTDTHVLTANSGTATGLEWVAPGAPGAHKDTHDPEDGADPLDTAAAAEISAVVAAGVGVSHSLARADHIHAINHAITDNHIVTIDQADAATGEYAKFTANGLESKSIAELLSDISVTSGADVTADNAPQAHKDTHDPSGTDPLDTAAAAEISVVVGAGAGVAESFARSDHIHQIQESMADNHIVTVNDADAADADFVKFTATGGVAGRSVAETLSDLSVTSGADVTGDNAPQAHKDSHDAQTGGDPLDTGVGGNIDGVQAAATGTAESYSRSDHAHRIQHAIADNAIVTVDQADAATGEYAKFTASGIESKSVAEVLTDLNLTPALTHKVRGTVSDPTNYYTQRAVIPVFRADAAITITRIHIHGPDSTATSEMALDLRFADDIFDGSFANPVVIDVCDTTAGAVTITAGFDDATVPSGKYVYWFLDAAPHADWLDFWFEIYYTYD